MIYVRQVYILNLKRMIVYIMNLKEMLLSSGSKEA